MSAQDVTAESMGVEEVVAIVLEAFRPPDNGGGFQFSNELNPGPAYEGSRVLLSFSRRLAALVAARIARRQRAAFAAAIESRHHDLRARAQASAGVVIPPG